MKPRTRSRTPVSIGPNQSSKRCWVASAVECSASDFVLWILMVAWVSIGAQTPNRLGCTPRRLRHFQFPPTSLRHLDWPSSSLIAAMIFWPRSDKFPELLHQREPNGDLLRAARE